MKEHSEKDAPFFWLNASVFLNIFQILWKIFIRFFLH